MVVTVKGRMIDRLETGKILMYPDFDWSVLGDKYEFFVDLEDPEAIIEYFEPMEASFDEIQLIFHGYVVDLFESKIDFFDIEVAMIWSVTQLLFGTISKMFDFIDVWWRFDGGFQISNGHFFILLFIFSFLELT